MKLWKHGLVLTWIKWSNVRRWGHCLNLKIIGAPMLFMILVIPSGCFPSGGVMTVLCLGFSWQCERGRCAQCDQSFRCLGETHLQWDQDFTALRAQCTAARLFQVTATCPDISLYFHWSFPLNCFSFHLSLHPSYFCDFSITIPTWIACTCRNTLFKVYFF